MCRPIYTDSYAQTDEDITGIGTHVVHVKVVKEVIKEVRKEVPKRMTCDLLEKLAEEKEAATTSIDDDIDDEDDEPVSAKDRIFREYTGVKFQVLLALINLVSNFIYWDDGNKTFPNLPYRCRNFEMPLKDQILLTLIKLRCNFTIRHLSFLFGWSPSTISEIFRQNLNILNTLLKPLVNNHPNPALNLEVQANCFQKPLTNKVTTIIDCTDIRITNHRDDFVKNKSFYSEYRGGQTMKALIGMSPACVITFASSFFPGHTSDKAIVEESGFLNILHPGDTILADKGFKMFELLQKLPGVSLALPAFKTDDHLAPHQIIRSKELSSGRSNIERLNERIKNFLIMGHLHHHYHDIASDALIVICALVNLQNPIFSSLKKHF